MKLLIWNDGKAKEEVSKRFKNAAKERSHLELSWKRSERAIYSTSNLTNATGTLPYSVDAPLADVLSAGNDHAAADINVAYAFKNFRFLHAQMSANPPTVAMRPTTSDQDDHRKADAADRITRWALRHYNLQEKQDQVNLQALLYGTGVMKTVWDSTRGAILDVDIESGEMKLEGDIDISVPFTWNIYFDPDAKTVQEIKWVIEKLYMDYDEACLRWPDKKDILENARAKENEANGQGHDSEIRNNRYNSVQLLEYWETGLATNGYLGRYCVTTLEGEVLETPRPSPFRFKKAGAVSNIEARADLPDDVKEAMIAKLPEQASLPYHILTDVDVPNQVWGMSAVEYISHLQENLSRLDSSVLDNIQAHGVARMILPETADVADDSLSDNTWDVVKITGAQPPFFMAPPQLMPDMTSARANYVAGINDVMGVNESMFGQQSREQAAAAMQYATNQGNMIRRRLFNKFVAQVESSYRGILNLIRKHWTVTRTISVLGKEKALEAIDVKGADIDGGFDVVGEYGVTLSLDPITRREEILTLQPLFEKAGVPARTSMKMLKLNELDSMFDELDLAENRQKEIFDAMIATGSYIPPEEQMDHENMVAYALHYFMTQEFNALDTKSKMLCKQHNKERGQLAASEKSGGAGAPALASPASPGPVPGQPAGPVPPPAPGPLPQAG